MINGFDSLIVTKLDVLDELAEIPVCVGYKLDGRQIEEMPARHTDLERLQPVLERRKGWNRSTRGISRYEDLPAEAHDYLNFLHQQTGVEIGCVSTGPERDETMLIAGSKLAQLIDN
jgi:adenylosuccinate synthase